VAEYGRTVLIHSARSKHLGIEVNFRLMKGGWNFKTIRARKRFSNRSSFYSGLSKFWEQTKHVQKHPRPSLSMPIWDGMRTISLGNLGEIIDEFQYVCG